MPYPIPPHTYIPLPSHPLFIPLLLFMIVSCRLAILPSWLQREGHQFQGIVKRRGKDAERWFTWFDAMGWETDQEGWGVVQYREGREPINIEFQSYSLFSLFSLLFTILILSHPIIVSVFSLFLYLYLYIYIYYNYLPSSVSSAWWGQPMPTASSRDAQGGGREGGRGWR